MWPANTAAHRLGAGSSYMRIPRHVPHTSPEPYTMHRGVSADEQSRCVGGGAGRGWGRGAVGEAGHPHLWRNHIAE